jgi:glycine C-acetyltransferase
MTDLHPFHARTQAVLQQLRQTGQHKSLQSIEGPMGPTVNLRGYGECLCFCSNNYLGLANHPEVVEAGRKGLDKYGAGTASVRFICGTFAPHEELERTIADFMGVEASYTFVSCWNANEAIFPTLCEPGDAIISDELNHASIIDGIRLATVIKKGIRKGVFEHGDHDSLRARLQELCDDASFEGVIWVVTDGVFSMEGDIADLPGLRAVCDEFNALLIVDDSHGTGVMGKTGRGVHEHQGMAGSSIDFFTGTLGKALGGAAGGFIAGPADAIDMIVQRGRPTLFSNALPVSTACSAKKAIEILDANPSMVDTLRANVAYARKGIKAAGFDVIDSSTAICPIIVGDTAKAISMSKRLLEIGVFVIGFGYPVVPEGEARLRVQISAAHTKQHLDGLIDALNKL